MLHTQLFSSSSPALLDLTHISACLTTLKHTWAVSHGSAPSSAAHLLLQGHCRTPASWPFLVDHALVVFATSCCQGQSRGDCASAVSHTTQTTGAPAAPAATQQGSDFTWELLSCVPWEAQQPPPACSSPTPISLPVQAHLCVYMQVLWPAEPACHSFQH